MSTLWLGFFVAAGTIVSPLILSYLTGRQRRSEKEADWKREDDVADRAAEASLKLLERQDVLAAKVQENTDTQVASAGKLDQIHTLVNSNLTAAMEATLEATKAQLVMMRTIPTADATAIDLVEAKVAELEKVLADRAEQTRVADAQAKAPQ